MRKRLVSILMALCMAVSLLPVQALAADDAYTLPRISHWYPPAPPANAPLCGCIP